ncbi:hypothetical protein [Paraurantiacibacter namhicola]|uniref:Uncharacterized protein n=1 Tax=Paraurantiacibacter namhicola TaxID=645517 RepID=A0A1C7D961_9SPHN|nr:hypothetical protein [Paraurantiacibacter namhicola]ANU08026.1 hypothetical protein A6F65_01729 [Paraurantiacibacter namhicola]
MTSKTEHAAAHSNLVGKLLRALGWTLLTIAAGWLAYQGGYLVGEAGARISDAPGMPDLSAHAPSIDALFPRIS